MAFLNFLMPRPLFSYLQNPQADLQAQDRCHRLGQTKPVVVYRLVTANTIDQKIVERASAKRKLEQMVIHKSELPHDCNSRYDFFFFPQRFINFFFFCYILCFQKNSRVRKQSLTKVRAALIWMSWWICSNQETQRSKRCFIPSWRFFWFKPKHRVVQWLWFDRLKFLPSFI